MFCCLFVRIAGLSPLPSSIPPLTAHLSPPFPRILVRRRCSIPLNPGHAIVYKPGLLFAGLWNLCKPVMDPKTVRKVIFVRGDVSDGSANDKLLTEIIGPKWREWCDCPKDASVKTMHTRLR